MNDTNQDAQPCTTGLHCGVMTSSAGRYLRSLFEECYAVSGVHLFDLMILRDIDIQQMERGRKFRDIVAARRGPSNYKKILLDEDRRPNRVTSIFSQPELTPLIAEWYAYQCQSVGVRVPALASYFPDVTSDDQQRRDEAVGALVQTALIALQLTKQGVMDYPIVEMVAGTILDPQGERGLKILDRPAVFEYAREHKLETLCRSLERVVEGVRDAVAQDSSDLYSQQPVVFAVEMEPGPTYVLGDGHNEKEKYLLEFVDLVQQSETLTQHASLNFDLAHWLIAGIRPELLSERADLRDRITHCHVADHPGKINGRTHTRDHAIGSFSTVEQWDEGEYYPYLWQLFEMIEKLDERKTGLPFSHTISIELEGNNRIFWLHDSVVRLRHAILATRVRRSKL